MKLRTEIVGPDSTSAHPYPAARVDDDGQDYLHDAAAAHALQIAMNEEHDKAKQAKGRRQAEWLSCYMMLYRIRDRADELMRQWGFTDE